MLILSGWNGAEKEMRLHWHVACIIELSLSEVTSFGGDRKAHLDGKGSRHQQSAVTAGKSICGKVADGLLSPKSELGLTGRLANLFVTINPAMHSSRRGCLERQAVT
jgi:hypothetical protein